MKQRGENDSKCIDNKYKAQNMRESCIFEQKTLLYLTNLNT